MSDKNASMKVFLIINEDQVFYLEKDETIIGRSHESDLVINDQRISRKHAKISAMNGKFLLTDLNSSGGSYVNGKPIVQKLLAEGDILTFTYGQKIFFHKDLSKLPPDVKPYEPEAIRDSKAKTAALDEADIEGFSSTGDSE